MTHQTVFADVESLEKVIPGREIGAYALIFEFGEATVSIRVVLNDPQTGAPLLITNMTTLPQKKSRNGFGSRALRALLEHTEKLRLTHVRATQVQVPSFWTRNGFVPVVPSPTRDYVYIAL